MKTKAKKSPAKPKPATEPHNPYAGIWEACDWNDCHIGYLVTLPDDIDRPLAFIGNGVGMPGARPLELAQRIMRDPSRAWRSDGADGTVIDLRYCSQRIAFPRFVYSLRCTPLDRNGKPLKDVLPQEPTPFCQFLFNELSERTITLASDADARRMPNAK